MILIKMKIEVDSINKKLIIKEIPDPDIRITPSVEIQSMDDSFTHRITEKDVKSVTQKAKTAAVKSIDQNANNKIDWNESSQIFILSTDGKTKTQLTNNDFFVKHLTSNKNTGTIVVSGYYDKNKNNKFDENDKSEIIIYDLKTLKAIN